MPESKEPPGPATSYQRRFPEAGPIFQAQYCKLAEVLEQCIVVLDTNALLVPFGTGTESLEQIRQTYAKLAGEGRLIVPGQVAREFAVHRPSKLAELYHAVSLKQDIPNPKSGDYPLLTSTQSYADVQHIEVEVRSLLKKYRETVKSLLAEIQGWTWDDPVSRVYREVFPSEVVVDPLFDEEELSLRRESSIRDKLPPGYKDGGKDTNADGDLRIWMTILQLARERKQHAVLVSGDAKADWWHRSNATVLYPRFELVDEYRRASGGKSFHIAQFSSFLLTYGAGSAVVAEVRSSERTLRLETLPRSSRGSATALLAEQAVFNWLTTTYPILECRPVDSRGAFVDFELSERGGATSAILVKYVSDIREFPYQMFIEQLDSYLAEEQTEAGDGWFFMVTSMAGHLSNIVRRLERASVPDGISVFPAVLRDDGRLDVHDVFGMLPNFASD